MNNKSNTLTVIDGETLIDKRLPPTKYFVDTLLPQGISILGGAPKVGKSWFVLDLCIHIARGEPLWNLPVSRGEVLYICLEDTEIRTQERLNTVTDDVPSGLYFAWGQTSLEDGLCEFIRTFKGKHPALALVAIDTFQMIRTPTNDVSYGGDYAEIQPLKALAEELNISLLLVHHLRKANDKDPTNTLSGSTGIAGAMDAIFIMERHRRGENKAKIFASGRDIRDREIELEFDSERCVWNLVNDSLQNPEIAMPSEMVALVEFMKSGNQYYGSNSGLADELTKILGREVSPKGMKQSMNKWRYKLEEVGVSFESKRSNGQKLLRVKYNPPSAGDASDSSDSKNGAVNICVPSVPCVPDES